MADRRVPTGGPGCSGATCDSESAAMVVLVLYLTGCLGLLGFGFRLRLLSSRESLLGDGEGFGALAEE